MMIFSCTFVTTFKSVILWPRRNTSPQGLSRTFSTPPFGSTITILQRASSRTVQVLENGHILRLLAEALALIAQGHALLLLGVAIALKLHHHDTSLAARIFAPTRRTSPPTFASHAVKLDTPGSNAQRLSPLTSSKTKSDVGSAQTASSCATNGILTPPRVRAAIATIDARFAATRGTTRVNARESLLKVVTPLPHDRWYGALKGCSLLDKFRDIPIGLRFGFKTGVTSKLITQFIPDNHRSALDSPNIVNDHIQNELRLHRYSGPFDVSQLLTLIGPFRTAPLGVVPKPNSNKSRIIQDLSFPRNNATIASVNSEINSDNFPCEWGSFAQCYFLVAKAPPGTQVAVFDVDSAYRNIPVHPEDQCHFCVSWNGKVYIDHCVAFGSASSAGLFGRVADCFVAIVQYHGAQQVIKWVDDFIFFRYPSNSSAPYQYSYSSSLIFDIACNLGLPWSLPKFHEFSASFTYLGFLWNIPDRSVQLPDAKKRKFSDRCNLWLSGSKQDLRSAQTLLGSLNHCCLVFRSARTHLFHL